MLGRDGTEENDYIIKRYRHHCNMKSGCINVQKHYDAIVVPGVMLLLYEQSVRYIT